MPITYRNRDACNNLSGCGCLSKDGCPPGVCPDFTIRRHDTKPPLRIAVSDCGQPEDLTDRVLEVNMWAKAKLKSAIAPTDTSIALADGIGFEQGMAGDTIVMERARNPEHMLITGFDEDAQTITVQRGWNGTAASAWKKGSKLKIFRILNSPAETEMVFHDVEEVDGSVTHDVLMSSYFVYEWRPEDTCLPGCYWLEFKLLKMKGLTFYLPGGNWAGLYHRDAAGNFLTGSAYTDSSVSLSFKVRAALPGDAIEAERWAAVEQLEAEHGEWEELERIHGDFGYGIGYDNGVLITPDDVEDTPPGFSLLDPYGRPRFGDDDDDDAPQPNAIFVLPHGGVWTGPTHLWSDGNYYTGSQHDDGSVYLNNTGIASDESVTYNSSGPVSVTPLLDASTFSTTGVVEVSTTSIAQCQLGAGVEWIRRYPISGEGFLIGISDSPTSE